MSENYTILMEGGGTRTLPIPTPQDPNVLTHGDGPRTVPTPKPTPSK